MTGFLRLVAFVAAMSVGGVAGAQTPVSDFASLPSDHPTVFVVDDSGMETKGRLLRFDAASVTLLVNKAEVRFERQQVNWIYERGDSLKNGMINGLTTGVVLALLAAVTVDGCGALLTPRPCDAVERLQIFTVLSGVFGGIGVGIGAGTDALIRGRSAVYQRPVLLNRGTASVAPAALADGGRVSFTLRW